jgi:hypothetical protein
MVVSDEADPFHRSAGSPSTGQPAYSETALMSLSDRSRPHPGRRRFDPKLPLSVQDHCHVQI